MKQLSKPKYNNFEKEMDSKELISEIAEQYQDQGIPFSRLLILGQKYFDKANSKLPKKMEINKRISMIQWSVRQGILDELSNHK